MPTPVTALLWENAKILGIEKDQVVVAGKQPDQVRARSVLAYWAIRYLGLTATEVGKYLGLSKSAVSQVAIRGQKLIVDQFLSLKDYKRAISTPSPFCPFFLEMKKIDFYTALPYDNYNDFY